MTSRGGTACMAGVSYRWAFSTLGCAEFSLAEAVELAARHQLDGLELRALSGSLDLPAVLAAEYGTPSALARAAEAWKPLRIVSLDTSLRLVGPAAEERAAFLAFVPWAEALRVRWLRVFDGGKSADDGEMAAAVQTLEWWRGQRAQHGWSVEMMIETHDSLFTAAQINRLFQAAPQAAILWDAHHTWKLGGEDPLTTWAAIAPQVVHVHMKDSISQPGAPDAYRYVLPGTGEFPARSLLARLRDEFSGTVSLEWERWWHPDLPPLEGALTAAAQNGWW